MSHVQLGARARSRPLDLVLYTLIEPDVLVDELQPTIQVSLPGNAISWTPSLEQCLERSQQYAWFVRSAQGDVVSDWSEGRLFEVVAAVPSLIEVTAALRTLENFFAALQGSTLPKAISAHRGVRPSSVSNTSPVEPSPTRSRGAVPLGTLAAGITAILGETPDTTGVTTDVAGLSHSPDGAGLYGENSHPGGADLRLAGAVPTELTESGLRREAPDDVTFSFDNPGTGSMELQIDGVTVVAAATDRDTLANLACNDQDLAKWNGTAWNCAADLDTNTLYSAGFGLDLNATAFSADITEVQQRVSGDCPTGGPSGQSTRMGRSPVR